MSIPSRILKEIIVEIFTWTSINTIHDESRNDAYYFFSIDSNNNYRINIAYAPIRLEFSCSMVIHGLSLDVDEILRLEILTANRKIKAISIYQSWQDNDISKIKQLLSFYSSFLESNIDYIIANYNKLEILIQTNRKEKHRIVQNNDILSKADKYFKSKNWNAYLQTISNYDGEENELIRKRIAFSKKQISRNN